MHSFARICLHAWWLKSLKNVIIVQCTLSVLKKFQKQTWFSTLIWLTLHKLIGLSPSPSYSLVKSVIGLYSRSSSITKSASSLPEAVSGLVSTNVIEEGWGWWLGWFTRGYLLFKFVGCVCFLLSEGDTLHVLVTVGGMEDEAGGGVTGVKEVSEGTWPREWFWVYPAPTLPRRVSSCANHFCICRLLTPYLSAVFLWFNLVSLSL